MRKLREDLSVTVSACVKEEQLLKLCFVHGVFY